MYIALKKPENQSRLLNSNTTRISRRRSLEGVYDAVAPCSLGQRLPRTVALERSAELARHPAPLLRGEVPALRLADRLQLRQEGLLVRARPPARVLQRGVERNSPSCAILISRRQSRSFVVFCGTCGLRLLSGGRMLRRVCESIRAARGSSSCARCWSAPLKFWWR